MTLQTEDQHLVNTLRSRTRGERIADEIGRALIGPAWHGPSLNALLAGVSAEDAVQRPLPAAHNIWELVLHITSWSNIARRRITGGQVEPSDGEDWPRPGPISENRWAEARATLNDSHERLREIVSGMSDDDLARLAPQSEATVAGMLHGVVQHAAYHGGQIGLLKKALHARQNRGAT